MAIFGTIFLVHRCTAMSTLRFIAFKIKSALTAKREIISLDVVMMFIAREIS